MWRYGGDQYAEPVTVALVSRTAVQWVVRIRSAVGSTLQIGPNLEFVIVFADSSFLCVVGDCSAILYLPPCLA